MGLDKLVFGVFWVLGFLCLLFCFAFCFNLRAFIEEAKLCLKRLIAIPPVIANAKHRDKYLMVSNCPNYEVSEMQNWLCCLFTL